MDREEADYQMASLQQAAAEGRRLRKLSLGAWLTGDFARAAALCPHGWRKYNTCLQCHAELDTNGEVAVAHDVPPMCLKCDAELVQVPPAEVATSPFRGERAVRCPHNHKWWLKA
jgi:hypothetical protein